MIVHHEPDMTWCMYVTIVPIQIDTRIIPNFYTVSNEAMGLRIGYKESLKNINQKN